VQESHYQQIRLCYAYEKSDAGQGLTHTILPRISELGTVSCYLNGNSLPGGRGPVLERAVVYDDGFHYLVVESLSVFVPERPQEVNNPRNSAQEPPKSTD